MDDQASTRGMAPSPTIQPVADADDNDGPDDEPVSAVPTKFGFQQNHHGGMTPRRKKMSQRSPLMIRIRRKRRKRNQKGVNQSRKKQGIGRKKKGKGRKFMLMRVKRQV